MAYKMKFNYNSGIITFAPGFKGVFLDKYLMALEAPARLDGDALFVKVDDLKKIYAPDFTYVSCGDGIAVTCGGVTVLCPANDGFVDAVYLLGKCFNKPVIKTDEFVAFCEKPSGKPVQPWTDRLDPFERGVPAFPSGAEDHFRNVIRGKPWGDIYRIYFCEELNKAVPYRLFVPFSYKADTPVKLLVEFHGGGGTPNSQFVNSGNKLQLFAEKFGYVIVAPDAGVSASVFGGLEAINGMRAKLDASHPENPLGYSPEEIAVRAKCERCTEDIIELTCNEYNIDRERMYLMGNSMGGQGTMHFASTHPKMFKAISPAGAMLDPRFYDDSVLGDLPVLVVGGLEDNHGFDFIAEAAAIMKEHGRNVRLLPVAGGVHGYAWATVLDEIFDFFEANA